MAPLRVGSFLPRTELPGAPSGLGTPLARTGREATVLVRIHDPRCDGCRGYIARLAASGIDLVWWEGRVVVLAPGSLADATALRAELGLSFTVVSDVDERVMMLPGAGVVVADRYGQVYAIFEAGASHDFPEPRELEEWLRFLAMQCPE